MKRIKYAGLATATLLAVAPVVFQTTTVDAATNDTTKAATTEAAAKAPQNIFQSIWNYWETTAQGYVNSFMPVNDDKVVTAVQNLQGETFDGKTAISKMKEYNEVHPSDKGSVTGPYSYKELRATNLISKATDQKAAPILGGNNASNYKYFITPSGSGSNPENDFKVMYENALNKGNGAQVQFDLTVKFIDSKNPEKSRVVTTVPITVTNNIQVNALTNELHVEYSSPLNVNVGASVLDTKLSSSVNAIVTNQDALPVQFKAVPGEIYRTEDSARTHTGDAITSSTFNNKGDRFYQPITITFADSNVDVKSIYDKMINDKSNLITFNGSTATSTDVNTSDKSITYVRVISVGEEPTIIDRPDEVNDGWSINNMHGVVTVKDEAGPLYNDDNKITSRSIDAHTGWQTDKYRINNENGEIQYRVSTHEWVNSDMVDFVQTEANEATSETAMTNITDLQGHHVISLSGSDKDKVYPLYNTNGKKLTRNLGQDSAWQTDKQATDSEGNTVYRVSTDEWVRLEAGVSFK
ncbi:hypothetical protein [Companilactobacillus mishanensis]|uniref:hypothetical protein n=1 Tax=Companilactobacillus mishanensis TaxID=2486008 RepID=UPI001294B99B|nr:hypothetical protein [Companilactobacillus mishanensis]MQS89626.1 hypothetical protein [Companilactobacillus mishanensis]